MAQFPEGFLDVFSVAELPSTHAGAFVERGGKAIRSSGQQGFLCFGQYKQGYPVIPLQAVFSISIDNNTKDDCNIFILDVYDHHSDRVIGKRVITRKDFERANEFCLFIFDFTPPSPQANMEFRIYYMGHGSVLADKIAVTDPTRIYVTAPSQIPAIVIPEPEFAPQPEVILQPEIVPPPEPAAAKPEVADTESLSEPWKIARIRNGKGTILQKSFMPPEINTGKGEADYQAQFTIETSGGETQGSADDLFFIYQKWSDQSGNGKIVGTFPAEREGFVGIMFRETLNADSKFVLVENNRILYREKTGGGVREKRVLPGDKTGRGLKLVRKRKGDEQYYTATFSTQPSASAENSDALDRIDMSMPQEVYVGVASGNAKATVKIGISYKDAKFKQS